MLPLSLRLQNFLSYGLTSSILDFRGISLACLTGDNGVGKSSLLEAITWSVWGCARVSSDDELLRVGTTDMEVEFQFLVADTKYRIIRKRSRRKSKGGVSTLEFQVGNNTTTVTPETLQSKKLAAPFEARRASEEWVSLTEPTIRATQEKIIDVVGMSYETFVNSAFLRQGHADEFTVKRPNERKAILSEILGLNMYDSLVERAREKCRLADAAIQSLRLYLDRSQEAQVDTGSLEATITTQQKICDETAILLKRYEEQVTALRAEVTQHHANQARLQAIVRHIGQLEETKTDHHKSLTDAENQLSEIHEILAKKEAIERDAKLYRDTFDRFQYLQEKQVKRAHLLTTKEQVQREYELLINAVKSEIQSLDGQKIVFKEATKKASEAKLELRQLEEQLEGFTQLQHSLEKSQERLLKLHNELAMAQERSSQLEREGKKIKDQQSQSKKLKGACPMCKQKLSTDHLKTMTGEFEAEIQELRTQFTTNQEHMNAVKDELGVLEGSITELRKSLVQFEELKQREGMLKSVIHSQEQARSELALLADQLEVLKDKLKTDPEIEQKSKELKKLDRELALLVVDDVEVKQCTIVLEQLAHVPQLKQQLDTAVSLGGPLEARIVELRTSLKSLDREYNSLLEERRALDSTAVALVEQETLLRQQEEELVVLRSDVNTHTGKLQVLQDQLRRAAEDEKRIGQQKKEMERHTKEAALYQELAEAFGKRGIQAMIIESAIPEIEEEANSILSRMTNNQMHVTFELQKEKKTGEGTIETLEIKISDGMGTRNYELFSGGEAFRINFAIRVALSRLLARRAGTKLRMLIIDEGFGTQDELGRDHLVSAIRAIRTDFDKIIVITHIPELKDAFAERIQITKTAQGSEIQMVA